MAYNAHPAYKTSTYLWEPGAEKKLRVTKTSLLSDFGYCPKQYEFKRIDGRKSPVTDAMTRGINVHDAMELFYVKVKPRLSEIINFAEKGEDEKALDLLLKSLPEPDEPYTLGEEPILLTRMEWEYARLLACEDKEEFLPVYNEVDVHAFIEESVEVNGETIVVPIHIGGKIDRAFRSEDGRLALMELKTGKWKIGDRYKLKNMRKEMAFYAWALAEDESKPDDDVSHWGWLYPAGDSGGEGHIKHWDYEKFKRQYIGYVKKDLHKLLESYITGNFQPTPSQGKCAWCDFMADCPAWQEGGDHHWPAYKQKPKIIQKEVKE
tara:strand:+ start:834 stop:1796 length:963 start_codon:yes stop_codon:yes gene_type:complete